MEKLMALKSARYPSKPKVTYRLIDVDFVQNYSMSDWIAETRRRLARAPFREDVFDEDDGYYRVNMLSLQHKSSVQPTFDELQFSDSLDSLEAAPSNLSTTSVRGSPRTSKLTEPRNRMAKNYNLPRCKRNYQQNPNCIKIRDENNMITDIKYWRPPRKLPNRMVLKNVHAGKTIMFSKPEKIPIKFTLFAHKERKRFNYHLLGLFYP